MTENKDGFYLMIAKDIMVAFADRIEFTTKSPEGYAESAGRDIQYPGPGDQESRYRPEDRSRSSGGVSPARRSTDSRSTPDTEILFFFDFSPATIDTREGATSSDRAMSLMTAALAFPSTGGAVTSTRRMSFSSPTIRVLPDEVLTDTPKETGVPFFGDLDHAQRPKKLVTPISTETRMRVGTRKRRRKIEDKDHDHRRDIKPARDRGAVCGWGPAPGR